MKKLLVIIGVIGIIYIIKRMLNKEEYIEPVKCPYIIEKYGDVYQVRYNA